MQGFFRIARNLHCLLYPELGKGKPCTRIATVFVQASLLLLWISSLKTPKKLSHHENARVDYLIKLASFDCTSKAFPLNIFENSIGNASVMIYWLRHRPMLLAKLCNSDTLCFFLDNTFHQFHLPSVQRSRCIRYAPSFFYRNMGEGQGG